MRQQLIKHTLKMKIALLVLGSFAVQGCVMGTRSAADYLPFSAQFLIDQDMNESKQGNLPSSKISVEQMLASLTGVETAEPEAPSSDLPHQLRPAKQTVQVDLQQTSSLQLREKFARDPAFQNGFSGQATLIIGPVGESETAQLASYHAMSKAHRIGRDLDDLFPNIRMRFDPLTPRDTLKIVLENDQAAEG
ncbi:hypothetical protein [Kiloniella sp. b19]|uniref:hypothetical protein n=1 Tax=Kiloniella sp. GXU_MW_B19 TaxID=3141326 RepID=UPI0031E1646E